MAQDRDDQGRFAPAAEGEEAPQQQAPPTAPPPPPPMPQSQWGATPEQAIRFYDEIADPTTRGAALERTLRQTEVLPADLTLDEARDLLRAYAAERSNPLGQLYPEQQRAQADQYGGGYGQPDYGQDPYGGQYQQPGAPAYDPKVLRQAWQQDQQQLAQSMREELRQELERERQFETVHSKVTEIAQQRGLGDDAVQRLLHYVGTSIDMDQQRGVQINRMALPQYVEQKVAELQALNGMPPPPPSNGGTPPPQTQVPQGQIPGGPPPARGVAGAADRARALVAEQARQRGY